MASHIDANKENNQLSNLEWCTQSHNIRHAYRLGLIDTTKQGVKAPKGQDHGMHKLTTAQVKEIREKFKVRKLLYREIGKIYNVSGFTINQILKRNLWKHI